MAEKGAFVLTEKFDYLCDQCGAQVVYTELKRSRGFLGDEETKMRYQHSCPRCKQVHWLDVRYPRFEYTPVDEYGRVIIDG